MIKPYITSITADTQVHNKPCVIYAIELSHTTDTTLVVYNEADSSKTAAYLVYTLRTTDEKQTDRPNIPDEGFFFPRGCYVDWTAGVGTVIWYPA